MDLEKEERVEFLNAYAVHPVEEPVLMYLLHKRFTQNELDRTYEEIAQLQVCFVFFRGIHRCSQISHPANPSKFLLISNFQKKEKNIPVAASLSFIICHSTVVE